MSGKFSLNNDSSAELWYVAHTDAPESKSQQFFGLSALFHTCALVSLMIVQGPLFETPTIETVTIEIEEMTPPPLPRAKAKNRVDHEGASKIAKAAPAARIDKATGPNDIVVPGKAVATKSAARVKTQPKAAPAKIARTAPQAAPKTVAAPPQVLAQESDVEIPDSIQSFEAPEMEEASFQASAVDELNTGDLDQSFAEVDEKTSVGVAAVKDEIEADADEIRRESLNHIQSLESQAAADAKAMAARTQELQARNAKALAMAQAAEAEARRKAALAAAGNGRGRKGQGQGASGARTAGPAAGAPNGAIRSLENLRQMPGNPKPRYSENERLNRQQGHVVFLAYISRAGYPTQFRQTHSTGYANLDRKTLDALKKWRFYPGQEGWVEIPFKWDLRGGPQETSALFKRNVSRK